MQKVCQKDTLRTGNILKAFEEQNHKTAKGGAYYQK
jgi:hypothetical protein